MSVRYAPVGWNANKYIYDAMLAFAVIGYLATFTLSVAQSPGPLSSLRRRNNPKGIRAYGSCAFLMLSIIFLIGPLARFGKKNLLTNSRRFGVATCIVALAPRKPRARLVFRLRLPSILMSRCSQAMQGSAGVAGFPF